jgi:hypothetical protein
MTSELVMHEGLGLGATNLYLLATQKQLIPPRQFHSLALGEIDDVTLSLLLGDGWDKSILRLMGARELALPSCGTVIRPKKLVTRGDGTLPREAYDTLARGGGFVERRQGQLDLELLESLVHVCLEHGISLKIGRVTLAEMNPRKTVDFRANFAHQEVLDAEMVAFSVMLPGLCMSGLEYLNLSRSGLSLRGLHYLLRPLNAVLASDSCSLRSINLNNNPFVTQVVTHLLGGEINGMKLSPLLHDASVVSEELVTSAGADAKDERSPSVDAGRRRAYSVSGERSRREEEGLILPVVCGQLLQMLRLLEWHAGKEETSTDFQVHRFGTLNTHDLQNVVRSSSLYVRLDMSNQSLTPLELLYVAAVAGVWPSMGMLVLDSGFQNVDVAQGQGLGDNGGGGGGGLAGLSENVSFPLDPPKDESGNEVLLSPGEEADRYMAEVSKWTYVASLNMIGKTIAELSAAVEDIRDKRRLILSDNKLANIESNPAHNMRKEISELNKMRADMCFVVEVSRYSETPVNPDTMRNLFLVFKGFNAAVKKCNAQSMESLYTTVRAAMDGQDGEAAADGQPRESLKAFVSKLKMGKDVSEVRESEQKTEWYKDMYADSCSCVKWIYSYLWAQTKRSVAFVGHGAGRARTCCSKAVGKSLASRITHLVLAQNNLGDVGACLVAWMADASRLPLLQVLNLEKNRVGSMGITAVLGCKNPNLEKLDLSKNNITSEMLTNLKMLQSIIKCNIKRLSLRDNLIGPQHFNLFTKAILDNKSIKCLDLRDNEIGDEGAQVLCDGLAAEPELEELLLENNGLTDDGVITVLQLMSKHGSMNVTSSLDGCKLITITKYQIAKVQLRLEPVLAAVEFIAEPLQLLSYPWSKQALWSDSVVGKPPTAAPTSAPVNSAPTGSKPVLSAIQTAFASLMLFFSNVPYGAVHAATLLCAWSLIIACIPWGKYGEDHLVKYLQRSGRVGASIVLWVAATIASTSLFLPVVDLLMRSYLCNSFQKLEYDKTTICWEGSMLAMVVVTSITIPFYVMLSLRAQRAGGDIQRFCVPLDPGNAAKKTDTWQLAPPIALPDKLVDDAPASATADPVVPTGQEAPPDAARPVHTALDVSATGGPAEPPTGARQCPAWCCCFERVYNASKKAATALVDAGAAAAKAASDAAKKAGSFVVDAAKVGLNAGKALASAALDATKSVVNKAIDVTKTVGNAVGMDKVAKFTGLDKVAHAAMEMAEKAAKHTLSLVKIVSPFKSEEDEIGADNRYAFFSMDVVQPAPSAIVHHIFARYRKENDPTRQMRLNKPVGYLEGLYSDLLGHMQNFALSVMKLALAVTNVFTGGDPVWIISIALLTCLMMTMLSASWEQPKYQFYFLNRVRMCANLCVMYFNAVALYFAITSVQILNHTNLIITCVTPGVGLLFYALACRIFPTPPPTEDEIREKEAKERAVLRTPEKQFRGLQEQWVRAKRMRSVSASVVAEKKERKDFGSVLARGATMTRAAAPPLHVHVPTTPQQQQEQEQQQQQEQEQLQQQQHLSALPAGEFRASLLLALDELKADVGGDEVTAGVGGKSGQNDDDPHLAALSASRSLGRAASMMKRTEQYASREPPASDSGDALSLSVAGPASPVSPVVNFLSPFPYSPGPDSRQQQGQQPVEALPGAVANEAPLLHNEIVPRASPTGNPQSPTARKAAASTPRQKGKGGWDF